MQIQYSACSFGWWLMLICSKRRVLLASCWWLICSERKVPLPGGWETKRTRLLFSTADLQRPSIPSVVDGLTPDQRKILFCLLTSKSDKDIRVCRAIIKKSLFGISLHYTQFIMIWISCYHLHCLQVSKLSAHVSQHTACHCDDEQRLATAVIRMTHSFVGSNNINLLHPQGQFGTRSEVGYYCKS
jgi:DNA topoisomerase-2